MMQLSAKALLWPFASMLSAEPEDANTSEGDDDGQGLGIDEGSDEYKDDEDDDREEDTGIMMKRMKRMMEICLMSWIQRSMKCSSVA
jgi:hypothetical protein